MKGTTVITPLNDRIVVSLIEPSETTESGIVLPETARTSTKQGTVLAVGEGNFHNGVRIPVDIAVGDIVLLPSYGGTEIQHNSETLWLFTARDALAVITE